MRLRHLVLERNDAAKDELASLRDSSHYAKFHVQKTEGRRQTTVDDDMLVRSATLSTSLQPLHSIIQLSDVGDVPELG